MFEWIAFYNNRHSALGYLSPAASEREKINAGRLALAA